MKRTYNVRLEPDDMDRLREIAASHGCLARSGGMNGQPAVGVLFEMVARGRLNIYSNDQITDFIQRISAPMLHPHWPLVGPDLADKVEPYKGCPSALQFLESELAKGSKKRL